MLPIVAATTISCAAKRWLYKVGRATSARYVPPPRLVNKTVLEPLRRAFSAAAQASPRMRPQEPSGQTAPSAASHAGCRPSAARSRRLVKREETGGRRRLPRHPNAGRSADSRAARLFRRGRDARERWCWPSYILYAPAVHFVNFPLAHNGVGKRRGL
jgi:hypothetical protein